MLGALETLAKSEYNNAGELLGLGDIMDNELMGYLNALDPIKRANVVNKLAKKHQPSIGSRAEFEKFFPELPANIRRGLADGKLRLADQIIYSIKPVSGAKTIKMFESQDVKQVGLRNISSGRLPKGTALMVSGIYLLHAVAASMGVDDVAGANYDTIGAVPALVTGEFTLKANKKILVNEQSNWVFKTAGTTMIPTGYYKLHNPRLIHDDVDIEMEIDLGTIQGLNANSVLFTGLQGTATIP